MNGKIMVFAVSLLTASVVLAAKPKPKPTPAADTFNVYTNKGDRGNHFAPSGWMGDYGDLKYAEDTENPADGKSDIKITYSAKGTQGANWAGIFWQQPPNNWGDKPGGYDLSAKKRLTFWARGEKGGEKIATFKVGGITGEHGDSDAQEIGPITLEKTWTKYTIDLKDKNLVHIIGGFCYSASRDDNPEGFTIHLDEIRFE